jgi:hypothetical protein
LRPKGLGADGKIILLASPISYHRLPHRSAGQWA